MLELYWLQHSANKDAKGMANSVDPDQIVPSCLILIYTVCSNLSMIPIYSLLKPIYDPDIQFAQTYLWSRSTVWSDLSVRQLGIFTTILMSYNFFIIIFSLLLHRLWVWCVRMLAFRRIFQQHRWTWNSLKIKLYCKTPKNFDTQKFCCNYPKLGTILLYYRVLGPKDADKMANSIDPDQSRGAVCSGSALFAQTCLCENLISLRYSVFSINMYIGLANYMYIEWSINFLAHKTFGIQPSLRQIIRIFQECEVQIEKSVWLWRSIFGITRHHHLSHGLDLLQEWICDLPELSKK